MSLCQILAEECMYDGGMSNYLESKGNKNENSDLVLESGVNSLHFKLNLKMFLECTKITQAQ